MHLEYLPEKGFWILRCLDTHQRILTTRADWKVIQTMDCSEQVAEHLMRIAKRSALKRRCHRSALANGWKECS